MSWNGFALALALDVGCITYLTLMGSPGTLPNIMGMGLTIPQYIFRVWVSCNNVQQRGIYFFFQNPEKNSFWSRTQLKLKQLAEELAMEGGEELDAEIKDSDGLSDGDFEQPSSRTGVKLENPTTQHQESLVVVTNHVPAAALVHDKDHGKAPPVPRRIGNFFS